MSEQKTTVLTAVLTAVWNTGRGYTANGQRIAAAALSDKSVIFADVDRGIRGKLLDHIPEIYAGRLETADGLKKVVMEAYDANCYEWEGIESREQMEALKQAAENYRN